MRHVRLRRAARAPLPTWRCSSSLETRLSEVESEVQYCLTSPATHCSRAPQRASLQQEVEGLRRTLRKADTANQAR